MRLFWFSKRRRISSTSSNIKLKAEADFTYSSTLKTKLKRTTSMKRDIRIGTITRKYIEEISQKKLKKKDPTEKKGQKIKRRKQNR
jgi:hypothetical protein